MPSRSNSSIDVRVSIDLPYFIELPDGDYPTSGAADVIRLTRKIAVASQGRYDTKTNVSAHFDAPATADLDELERVRLVQGDRLLARVNRLVRWYRAASRSQATIIEVTRAQSEPVRIRYRGRQCAVGKYRPVRI